MTRIWTLSLDALEPRLTNDVDLAVDTRIAKGARTFELLRKAGYRRDTHGYDFRYTRMTKSGLMIIDLLVDSAKPTEGALAIYGLGEAAVRTVDFELEITRVGDAAIRVPSLDGSFLLRALALEDGPEGLKFVDYATDAASLARLLEGQAGALGQWRRRSGPAVQRARDLVLPLFESEKAPGSIAAASRARGDSTLAARRASSAVRSLFA